MQYASIVIPINNINIVYKIYTIIKAHMILIIHIECKNLVSKCYEKRVDFYLNEYCANARTSKTITETVTWSQSHSTQHLQEPANTIETTVTRVNSTNSTTVAKSTSSSTVTATKPIMTALIALGAMLGLSLLTLAMVTAGWMWTCWRLKRGRNVKRLQSNTWTHR